MSTNTLQVQVATRGFMEGAIDRVSSKGNRLGKVLSYIGSCPAGDVRKQLKATGFKGQALRRKVGEVMRGEADMAWVLFDGQASVARSMGFVPVRTQANKKANVLMTRFEKVGSVASGPTAKEAAASLSDADLLAILEARKVTSVKPAINV